MLQYVFLVSWVWIAVYSNRLYIALANVSIILICFNNNTSCTFLYIVAKDVREMELAFRFMWERKHFD